MMRFFKSKPSRATPPPAQEAAATASSTAAPESTAESTPPPVAKTSWLAQLKRGLSRTGQNISALFTGAKVDDALYEELETVLIMADTGVEACATLLAALRSKVQRDKLTEAGAVKTALREVLAAHLAVLERPFPINTPMPACAPQVVMIAGVNGAGKMTGTSTFTRERAGDVPRLCAASSSCTSKPRMAASVPI